MNQYTSSPNGAASSGAPAPQREKVTFNTNVPTFVNLEFDPPTQPRAGRFGDQYMYWLAGNKIMFVDPPLHELIVHAGAAAGSEVCVTKQEIRNGSRRHIQWDVQIVTDETMVFDPAHRKPQASAPAPTVIAAPASPRAASAARAERTPTQPAALPPIGGNLMAAALTQAIEACSLAGFEASREDIRALAITIYIQAAGGRQK